MQRVHSLLAHGERAVTVGVAFLASAWHTDRRLEDRNALATRLCGSADEAV